MKSTSRSHTIARAAHRGTTTTNMMSPCNQNGLVIRNWLTTSTTVTRVHPAVRAGSAAG